MSLDKLDENDIINKQNLLKELEKEFLLKNKKTNIDSIIYFSGTKLPYIFACIGIAFLLIFLGYIIFYV